MINTTDLINHLTEEDIKDITAKIKNWDVLSVEDIKKNLFNTDVIPADSKIKDETIRGLEMAISESLDVKNVLVGILNDDICTSKLEEYYNNIVVALTSIINELEAA